MHKLRLSHFEALYHTLRYINATSRHGILLNTSDSLTLQAYSNSDRASYLDSRRSYVRLFGQSPVAWKSKKQTIIYRSSYAAE